MAAEGGTRSPAAFVGAGDNLLASEAVAECRAECLDSKSWPCSSRGNEAR